MKDRFPEVFSGDDPPPEDEKTTATLAIEELTTLVQTLHQKIDRLERGQPNTQPDNGSPKAKQVGSPIPPTMQDIVRV